jgi:hypothetical protein
MKTKTFLFVLITFVLLINNYSKADELIFVINTTQNDDRGPSTAPYLDETRWMKKWEPLVSENNKKIRIISIRANSNQKILKALEFWMTQDESSEERHEVKGLVVYSHGDRMVLLNESQEFIMKLPTDIISTFQPIQGRFSKDARIILTGCKVLWEQSPMTAYSSLKSIADSFGLNSGLIYANKSDGVDPYTLFADPFNADIKTPKRLAAFATYLLWPFSTTVLPIMTKYIYNQGYALLIDKQEANLLEINENKAFKIEINH